MMSSPLPARWDAAEVAEKILAIVRTRTYVPPTLDSTFESLGLDSLAMAEIVFEIENTFGIRTDDRLLDSQNLNDVVEYVMKKIEAQTGA